MRLLQLLRKAITVLLVAAIVVGIAAVVHQARPAGYTAEAVLVVPSTSAHQPHQPPGYQGPGLEDQAQKLAVTFAGLIPSDQAILSTVSRRLGRKPADVESRLTVLNDANTSLVRIRYKGDSASEAMLGADTVADAVSAAHPVTTAIPPGALMLIRLPDKTTTSYSLGILLGVGAALGLGLGLLLIVVRDRVNPLLNAPGDLSPLFAGSPIVTSYLDDEEIEALLNEWHHLAAGRDRPNDGSPPLIALLPSSRHAARAARSLAARVDGAGQVADPGSEIDHLESFNEDGDPDDATETGRSGQGAVKVRYARAAPTVPADGKDESQLELVALRTQKPDGELIARAGLIALVVTPGTSTRRVTRALDSLRQEGREPDVTLFGARIGRGQPAA